MVTVCQMLLCFIKSSCLWIHLAGSRSWMRRQHWKNNHIFSKCNRYKPYITLWYGSIWYLMCSYLCRCGSCMLLFDQCNLFQSNCFPVYNKVHLSHKNFHRGHFFPHRVSSNPYLGFEHLKFLKWYWCITFNNIYILCPLIVSILILILCHWTLTTVLDLKVRNLHEPRRHHIWYIVHHIWGQKWIVELSCGNPMSNVLCKANVWVWGLHCKKKHKNNTIEILTCLACWMRWPIMQKSQVWRAPYR